MLLRDSLSQKRDREVYFERVFEVVFFLSLFVEKMVALAAYCVKCEVARERPPPGWVTDGA